MRCALWSSHRRGRAGRASSKGRLMGLPFGNSPVEIACADGVVLRGLPRPAYNLPSNLAAIINPATGVMARYYHRYADYPAAIGFNVFTYDYRGIGACRSRQNRRHRTQHWRLSTPAKAAPMVERMPTIESQFAHWLNYALRHRRRPFLKWHGAMSAPTAFFEYFRGRRVGWLEELPPGVASEWSFRRSHMEFRCTAHRGKDMLARFNAFTAPTLAVPMPDDEFATPKAFRRGLGYPRSAERTFICLNRMHLASRRDLEKHGALAS